MMEGFGVHTFRFVNEQGKARFVKFHWKPVLGVHSLVWDEAQKLPGKIQISTAVTCGKQLKTAARLNTSSACR